MELRLKTYTGVDNTLENIKRIIKRNAPQSYMKPFDNWSLQKFYNYVRSLTYIKDPERVPISDNDNIELLKSPYLTIYTNGGDCDDKAILIGAYFERKKIPYRMAVISNKSNKEFHHIFPEVYLNGNWKAYDATYPLWDMNHTPSRLYVESPYKLKRIYDWSCGRTIAYNIDANHPELYTTRAMDCSAATTGNMNIAGRQIKTEILNGSCSTLAGTKLAILEGIDDKPTLGDPITATATIIASVASLFSGLFAKEKYVTAYGVWEQAAKAGGPAFNAKDWQSLGVNTAIVAVLGVDYMNPPWGADVCTSSNRCGNSAEWSKIQPAVETRVAEIAPFFVWLCGRKQGGFSMEEIYSYYKDLKNNGPKYKEFLQAMNKGSSSNTGMNIAGMNTSTLLIFGGLATAAYLLLK